MPDGWVPSAKEKQKAIDLRLNLDAEVDRFRTWTAAKDARFADWDAAFRNHLLAQAERRDARGGNGGRTSEQEWQKTKAESSAYAGWDVFAGGKPVERIGR
jgi:hypothetical protein